MAYVTGQAFDPAGMVITATYSDGFTRQILGWTHSATVVSSTVTISYTEGDTTATTTIPVTIIAVSSVLEENDWGTIQEVARAGLGANYWSLGDKKSIYVNGGYYSSAISGTFYEHILGFNHNQDIEGKGIHFQFLGTNNTGQRGALCSDNYGEFTSNSFYDYTPGPGQMWEDSSLRNFCARLCSFLPLDLRNAIAITTKYTFNIQHQAVTATEDRMFLLSEFEVFGVRTYADINEQTYQQQYAYYANNTAVLYEHEGGAYSVVYWWLRSKGSSNYCIVGGNGKASTIQPEISGGIAPAFKVG